MSDAFRSDTYVTRGRLAVALPLDQLIHESLLPGTGIEPAAFWTGFEQLVAELTPRNRALLARRDELQAQLDEWHRTHPLGGKISEYRAFLQKIGYVQEAGQDFSISTENVDAEIATLAGPQLVVPVTNARYALNAANARWGSLYDALYGTDVIPEDDGAARGAEYNPVRGRAVVGFGREFLDRCFPLRSGSHVHSEEYRIENGIFYIEQASGKTVTLKHPQQFAGYQGPAECPDSILLRNHGLHVEIRFDPQSPVGRADPAGICDIYLEAALTTIQDCEDSVVTVDAQDKVVAYRNWLGLMLGTLEDSFEKNGRRIRRILNPDRSYLDPQGQAFVLPGRSLLILRNVGHLMRTPAVRFDGEDMYEGLLDAVIGALAALHDLQGSGYLDGTPIRNSRSGSIYIVKPKMHGPEEVAFTVDLFARTEQLLGLAVNTIKIGIMDEERRTSVNLKACVRVARERLIFINTGFLDRTGDEIHTAMHAGAVVSKNKMRNQPWMRAYEDNNVDIGLACGLAGRAQIGKGMWAKPDHMSDMLRDKGAHLQAGASCAWVPSPTAATLHAIHYHLIDVSTRQQALRKRRPVSLDALLRLPLADDPRGWSAEEISEELENNCQGILGYVVRWVDLGVGCSKVPDIHGIGLMEDRATLRISSQHIANWLLHGVVSHSQVEETLARMAAVVDRQNADDPTYLPMTRNLARSLAYQAAHALIFEGSVQPNGYTEPILNQKRLERKSSIKAKAA